MAIKDSSILVYSTSNGYNKGYVFFCESASNREVKPANQVRTINFI